MLFKLPIITAITSVAFIAQGAVAGLTIDQVVTNINIVATLSGQTNTLISNLSPTTPPAEIVTTAQTVANNLQTIINGLTGDESAMKATDPFTSCDATQVIVDSLRNFVSIHQQVLSNIIGKHGVLAQFGATAPVAGVLSSLEQIIDAFANAMINMLPGCHTDDVNNDKSQLDKSLGKAIPLYAEFCIPSILYPTVQPICI